MRLTLSLVLAVSLAGCALRGPPMSPGAPYPGPGPGAGAEASPGTPSAPAPVQPPNAPVKPRMGPAATALLGQAHSQAAAGEFAAAGATLERALRIEPDTPQLWVELGRLQLEQGNPTQAEQLGRKALSLASGDTQAQAAAWTLIADSLRARNRDADAADAERRATALAPR